MELKKIDLTPPTGSEPVKPVIINSRSNKPLPIIKIGSLVLALVLGLGVGFVVKGRVASPGRPSGSIISTTVPEAGLKEGDIIGVQDEKTFTDSVTGVLQKGGLDGEGSHKLLRPGGNSQTVYLTSSVIDLDEFIGNQVTLWGQTLKGQKAGWLMDVGRARVEKLNAPNPE